MTLLAQQDPEVASAIAAELIRQDDDLELIASENYVSRPVLEALGSALTNKYAEGLPGKRYYGGCEHVDTVEVLARSRLKQLFGCDGANVQPHSGAQANQAVYLAAIKPGDAILGLDLSHGGHLTHGSPVNSSGKLYQAHAYHLGADGRIDMNEVRDLALKHRPKLIVVGASAYPRILDFPAFRAIADEVDAVIMADIAHIAGLVCTGLHPSPVPYCEYVTSTTHKTLRGPRGGLVLCRKEFAKEIDRQVFPGIQGGPFMHVIASKAVCFNEALQPAFKTYAEQVVKNAKALAAGMEDAGLRIVSGGTDNHVMLVDLSPIDVTGKDAAAALDRARITVNKNAIPFDSQSPFVTSGIRLGSPAVTTRGFTEEHMRIIADLIRKVLTRNVKEETVNHVREEVIQLTSQFPIP